MGDTLTDVVEVGCLATDNAAQHDDGIVAVVECHLTGTVDKFERTGYRLDMDVLGQCAVLFQCADTAFEQGARNLRVPLSHDDAENHVRGIGNLCRVVF